MNSIRPKHLRTTALSMLGILSICVICLCSCQKRMPSLKNEPLRIWQTETDKDAIQVINEVIEALKARNPGLRVELESIAWNSLSSKLTIASRADNEPDVAHLEPFMVNAFIIRNALEPLDDVIAEIESENKDAIMASVRDLQFNRGKHYGIAYAVGTTGFSYRKDIADALHLSAPKTWAEFVVFCREICNGSNQTLKVLLPGGDPFFIDQLFAELVANNGGRIFDPSQGFRPLLDSKEVIQVFEFLAELSNSIDPAWQTLGYLDQFNRLGRGEAGVVPVTYSRAAKAIEKAIISSNSSELQANPNYFALMEQPTGPSFKGESIATIDCEPYVIFKSARQRGLGKKSNLDYAKEFLKLFYKSEYYLKFVKKVPIHLTPIFEKLSKSPDYVSNSFIQKWQQWADQSARMLMTPGRVRPILMPDDSELGRQVPFLLEFQASRIISRAVTQVVTRANSPREAAREAQKNAEAFIRSIGY